MSKTLNFPVDFAVANRDLGTIGVAGLDELHYRLERYEGSGSLTGTIQYGLSLADDDEPSSWSNLNTNGSIHKINIGTAAFVRFRIGTAQSGKTGVLHTYARAKAPSGGGGGGGGGLDPHTHDLEESYVGEIAEADDQDYTIDLRVPVARVVTEFSIISASGTCTAALKNGSDTIVGSVAVSSTIATKTGGDLDGTHKNLSVNDKLVLTLSSNSTALRVQFCVKYTAVTGAIT
jgi:hypothetical protein